MERFICMKIIKQGTQDYKVYYHNLYVDKNYLCIKCNTIIRIEIQDKIFEYNPVWEIKGDKPYRFVYCPECSEKIILN